MNEYELYMYETAIEKLNRRSVREALLETEHETSRRRRSRSRRFLKEVSR
jgi:hypothetical protein